MGMRTNIKEYVASCDICQKNKSNTQSQAGLLQPLPIPNKSCVDTSIDFIGGLPQLKENITF